MERHPLKVVNIDDVQLFQQPNDPIAVQTAKIDVFPEPWLLGSVA
jgi:hypothetical protein